MSADRLLGILDLYAEQPVWTAEALAKRLHVSVSTAYRYVRSLCRAGLLDPAGGARVVLGPAIIEYDRRIRASDPVLTVAAPIMQKLAARAGREGAVVLTRLYRDRVMCVHQQSARGGNGHLTQYERGRPMSMFKGATSKVILAFLPDRKLKRLFLARRDEIKEARLGNDWKAFKANLRDIRREGFCRTVSEITRSRTGIAAPVFDERGVIGSLSVVVPARQEAAAPRRLTAAVVEKAAEISAQLQGAPASRAGKTALRTAR
jgi:DNA-binding IclR family transcriptional regulator